MGDSRAVRTASLTERGTARMAQACRLMGSFRGISQAFLGQTLTKQVISHLRPKLSYQVCPDLLTRLTSRRPGRFILAARP